MPPLRERIRLRQILRSIFRVKCILWSNRFSSYQSKYNDASTFERYQQITEKDEKGVYRRKWARRDFEVFELMGAGLDAT